MQSLEEYEREKAKTGTRIMENTGIACPDCGAELSDDGLSLISLDPQMKRVTCAACGFSKVVLA